MTPINIQLSAFSFLSLSHFLIKLNTSPSFLSDPSLTRLLWFQFNVCLYRASTTKAINEAFDVYVVATCKILEDVAFF